MTAPLPSGWPRLRRLAVTVAGTTVLALGIAMLVLPGPAFLVIPAGLAILATEYRWARRLIDRTKDWARRQREKARERKARRG